MNEMWITSDGRPCTIEVDERRGVVELSIEFLRELLTMAGLTRVEANQ